MQIVGAGGRVVAPGTGLLIEVAPALGWRAALRGPPVVVGAVGIIAAAAAVAKPGVLVAGVVDHQVHHQLEAALVHTPDHGVEVGHGAHLAHDGPIVADVVTVVVVGGLIDRVEPNDVDAEALDVVEAGGNAAQITDAVAIRVLEAARVDLVDHHLFPPGPFRSGGTLPPMV